MTAANGNGEVRIGGKRANVHDVRTGETLGRTDDPEALFLALLDTAIEEGEPCYVVVGPDAVPDGLAAELATRQVPVVVDARLGTAAVIVDGDPSGWDDVARTELAEAQEAARRRRPSPPAG